MNTLPAAWICLLIAGIFEIGWPVGLKIAQTPGRVMVGVLMAGTCMVISGWLLWTAQKQIPMGTAYAVWTGIGAAGAFFTGVLLYGDPFGVTRFLGVALIVGGVVTLKLAH
jgi:quaternary ammonium compound-resistance protein SugE